MASVNVLSFWKQYSETILIEGAVGNHSHPIDTSLTPLTSKKLAGTLVCIHLLKVLEHNLLFSFVTKDNHLT